MTFKVTKNRHRFSPLQLGLVFSRRIIKSVRFDASCKYNLGDQDQLDINKLFGVGYFWHHQRNSARVGWRWNIKSQRIELFSYVYDKGERLIGFLCDVALGSKCDIMLEVGDDHYVFTVVKANGLSVMHWVDIKGKFMKVGYKLGPYFGGNKTAPQNMAIEIR